MTAYISLLRGINVGGHRKVPMKELAALYDGLGLAPAKTYIQSGNVVFLSDQNDAGALAGKISMGIEARFGFDVGVLVYSLADWIAILEANPYPDEASADGAKVLVTLLAREPDAARMTAIEKACAPEEDFKLIGQALYLKLPNGAGRSKLAEQGGRVEIQIHRHGAQLAHHNDAERYGGRARSQRVSTA